MDTVFTAAIIRLPLAPAEGLYLDACAFTHYDARFSAAHGGSLSYLRPAAAAAQQEFKETRIWPFIAASVSGDTSVLCADTAATTTETSTDVKQGFATAGSGALPCPFRSYAAALAADPPSYNAKVPPQLKAIVAQSDARRGGRGGQRRGGAGGKRWRGGRNGDDAEADGDDDGGNGDAAGVISDRAADVDPALLQGGAISRVAREAATWKAARRAEKESRGTAERS